MTFMIDKLEWTREPEDYKIFDDRIEIVTKPHTDLWQRTYYHFRNDNAPVLQMETEEPFFSFTVKTEFESKHRFDQCGIDSVEERMIIALNAQKMELHSSKCECVICGTAAEQFGLVFMHAVRKILPLKRHSPIWS